MKREELQAHETSGCAQAEAKTAVRGNPLWAVLIPPRLIRFRELTQIDDEQLDVDFTGWNKFVLLAADRAYLFPRDANGVEWFERELAAYRVLEPLKLPVVPRLLEEWRDQTAYPYPFAVVSRLPGSHPADASDLIDPLYRFVAQWHDSEPAEIPGSRPPAHHDRADNRWLRRALDPRTTRDAVAEAADRLRCESRVGPWSRRMEEAAMLSRVVVHGDIHEDQLLVVDGQLTGILDWETARALTIPFGTSISVSGGLNSGGVTGSSFHDFGRSRGGPMPANVAWIRTPRHSRRPSGCATHCFFWTIREIRRLRGRSKSISRPSRSGGSTSPKRRPMAVYDGRRLLPSHHSLLDETTTEPGALPCTTQKIEVEVGSDSMKLPSGSDSEQMIHHHTSHQFGVSMRTSEDTCRYPLELGALPARLSRFNKVVKSLACER